MSMTTGSAIIQRPEEAEIVEARAARRLFIKATPDPAPSPLEPLYLGSLNDNRFRIVEPISVTLSKEGEYVVAEASEIDEYGYGSNVAEARSDLQRSIVELYFTLQAEQELGPDLLRVWDLLHRKVTRIAG